jgi:hypothetical protein
MQYIKNDKKLINNTAPNIYSKKKIKKNQLIKIKK